MNTTQYNYVWHLCVQVFGSLNNPILQTLDETVLENSEIWTSFGLGILPYRLVHYHNLA